jgi:hypothetical protein
VAALEVLHGVEGPNAVVHLLVHEAGEDQRDIEVKGGGEGLEGTGVGILISVTVEKGDLLHALRLDREGEGALDLILSVRDSLTDLLDGDKELDITKSDIEDPGGTIIACVRVEVAFRLDVPNALIEGESISVLDTYLGKVTLFRALEVLEEYLVGFDREPVRSVINPPGLRTTVCQVGLGEGEARHCEWLMRVVGSLRSGNVGVVVDLTSVAVRSATLSGKVNELDEEIEMETGRRNHHAT